MWKFGQKKAVSSMLVTDVKDLMILSSTYLIYNSPTSWSVGVITCLRRTPSFNCHQYQNFVTKTKNITKIKSPLFICHESFCCRFQFLKLVIIQTVPYNRHQKSVVENQGYLDKSLLRSNPCFNKEYLLARIKDFIFQFFFSKMGWLDRLLSAI